jgi:hypothetical protein
MRIGYETLTKRLSENLLGLEAANVTKNVNQITDAIAECTETKQYNVEKQYFDDEILSLIQTKERKKQEHGRTFTMFTNLWEMAIL